MLARTTCIKPTAKGTRFHSPKNRAGDTAGNLGGPSLGGIACVELLALPGQPDWDIAGPCANALAVAEWCLAAKVPPLNIFLFLDPLAHRANRNTGTDHEIQGKWRQRYRNRNI